MASVLFSQKKYGNVKDIIITIKKTIYQKRKDCYYAY